jgi:hypothetical protein
MEGDLIENIQSVAEDKIDFVVMGTAGVTDWDAVLWDLTWDVIIRIAVRVVYTLGAKYNPIKTIGFTTRYRDKDKNAINTILDFAKLINASVKCLYVKTSDSDVSSETIED